MQASVTRTFWRCDMCKCEILEAQFTHVTLGESTWDICVHCAQRLRPSLEFLNEIVGIDVKYSVSEGAQ